LGRKRIKTLWFCVRNGAKRFFKESGVRDGYNGAFVRYSQGSQVALAAGSKSQQGVPFLFIPIK
jgi:hypothetical protein